MSKRKDDFEESSVSNAASIKKKKTDETLSEQENSLLANLMAYHMQDVDGVSFEKCAADLGFMKRTKSWAKAWSQLIDMGLIVSCVPGGAKTTANHCLTDAGKAQASTPEYEEFVKDKTFVAATNEDHQDRIKKRLISVKNRKRCVQIFDLLLEHGSLTRKEMCSILNLRSGTHSFSYALKELKDKGLVSGKGSEKLVLSDKAFLDPSTDRPTHVSDQDTINALVSKSKYADEMKKGRGKKYKTEKNESPGANKNDSKSQDDEEDEDKQNQEPVDEAEKKDENENLDDDTVADEEPTEKVPSLSPCFS